ncbi:hypothetical protein [Natrarchaeobius oligotrophus]|uniref:Uncharacterized protein n=1 Tax=Natrarchaeobius chitinivorans TaxID=1679083 RepID=A0A3N6PB62_NATCH|nr:hypothetical protein [Natrarchaeobius chitinivorans]RQG93745.1 hypothetical protein EA472_22695 [Natrarchaeobius chitinivorans]
MTDSSIPVSTEFREDLQERKRDGESYEEFLKRRLEDGPDSTDDVPDELLEEIDTIVDRRLGEQLRNFRDDLFSQLR